MRDMRPLNSDSYSPTSNLMTNNHPSNKPSSNTSTATTTSGKTKSGKNNKEYECVWEVPSGKSLTLLARDISPNKMSNQYLNENRGSTSTSKLDSFKQKNLIVKTPLKDDLKQKAFFGNSQAGKTGGGTCSCCCQENFTSDPLFQQGPRRMGPAVTSTGHVTIGHMPRHEDAPGTSPQKQPSCLTFPKQSPSSSAALATRQNHLNNNINNLQLAEEVPGHVCRHCGHSSDDSTFISESTPSVFVDSTAPAPVLSHRLVTPGSETLARKSFLPINAAEMFKRSQDSGMPSSLGSIRHQEGHDPVTSTRLQQQLSQRHSVPREASNNSNNVSSAETPPVLHPRKRRT